jgi:hypothetical protein
MMAVASFAGGKIKEPYLSQHFINGESFGKRQESLMPHRCLYTT